MTQSTLQMLITGYDRQEARVSDADVMRRYGVTTVHRLSQNENPLGPSPKVLDAIQEAALTLASYPNYSDIELREAIAEVTGRGITPHHIYTGMSGYEALEILMRGFVKAGDEVIVSTPTFISAYQKTTILQGAHIVDVPLQADTFDYDVDGVIAAITPRTRLILLCNPNNPTGTIVTASQFDDLMQRVPAHVLVVSDEVYHHYVHRDDYPDALQYVLDGKNLVLTYSFSKAYGLAGLRLGYGVARPEIADYLASFHRGFHHSAFTLAAGIAAVKDQAYVQHVIDYTEREMQWMLSELDRLDVYYWQPAANFVLFKSPYETRQMTEKFMEVGILVRPQHKSGLHDCVRVSIGTHEANQLFIQRLEAILETV
ncbi:MAG: histidinol-phosphate transaminase [Phototrophicaceae bacterium]